ncbi:hypothetical protein Bca52824_086077 [Brassica carinata]|uniref:Jacalin-type lectin domain-containing protein n=1 Tax=Brassica carinata TaxID=52824 RepID=A0A8X7TLV0_BRACI|nr:hypothetical protein Bca52824_086077 [Brassica carinata]
MLLVRYFVTTTTPLTSAKKLPAVGGDGGIAWDDGAYDGVRKVFVGQAQDGISVVKLICFVLDYPSEYITSLP